MATVVGLDNVRGALAGALRSTTFVTRDNVTFVSEIGQHTGSFKARGAFAAVAFSDADTLITASSGNFGAALAWATQRAEKACVVVMPSTSVQTKIDAVRSFGATVDLVDTNITSRQARVAELLLTMPAFVTQSVSPYDDERVILGNATLGFEILAHADFDAVLVPVGGGGLSSGIVVARDANRARPKIYGVEPSLGDDGARSIAAGRLLANEREPATICDGARTLSLGQRNFAILERGLAGMLTVDDDAVRAAQQGLHALGIMAEPTGALAYAALQQNSARFADQRVAVIVSGGNY